MKSVIRSITKKQNHEIGARRAEPGEKTMRLRTPTRVLAIFLASLAGIHIASGEKVPPPDFYRFEGKLLSNEKVWTEGTKGKDIHVRNIMKIEVLKVTNGPVKKGQIVLCEIFVTPNDSDDPENPKAGTFWTIEAHVDCEYECETIKHLYLLGCTCSP